jgi:hypothetical protein
MVVPPGTTFQQVSRRKPKNQEFCVVLGPLSGPLCGSIRVKTKLGNVSLAAHTAGIDLMVVLSVFSERAAMPKLPM